MFWLIKGKAVHVTCDDELQYWSGVRADMHGGVYAKSNKCLWYFQNGKASQVGLVPLAKIKGAPWLVTERSLFWSILNEYGAMRYESGKKDGYQEGHEDAQTEE